MGRYWIIDVLADLRRFARENDMPLLTAQLEEAGLVAEVEIASSLEVEAASPRNECDIRHVDLPKLVLFRRP